MAYTLAKQPKTPLKDRIEALRSEIDSFIDELAEKEKAGAPGIPLAVIRNLLTARGGECQCRQFLIATGELK